MPVFIGKVKLEKKKMPYEDRMSSRIWKEIAIPLQARRASSRATAEDEAASKALLIQTLERCRRLLPKTKRYLMCEYFFDEGYLGILLELRNTLLEKRWGDACYQTLKMIRYYHGSDIRTMYSIIGILEEFL